MSNLEGLKTKIKAAIKEYRDARARYGATSYEAKIARWKLYDLEELL